MIKNFNSVQPRRLSTSVAVAFATVTLALTAGCGDGEKRYDVYPVSGKVLRDGQPVEGARVTFYLDEIQDPKRPIPTAETEADGSYKLTSYQQGDGAPTGNYHVTVIWPEPIPADANPETYSPADRLNGKYANPERSGLEVTVTEANNVLEPFVLE